MKIENSEWLLYVGAISLISLAYFFTVSRHIENKNSDTEIKFDNRENLIETKVDTSEIKIINGSKWIVNGAFYTVNKTGTWYVGDNYQISLVNELPCKIPQTTIYTFCRGISYIRKIQILNGMSLDETRWTCNHEICHTKYSLPYSVEEPICVDEEYQDYSECVEFIEAIYK